MTTPIDKALVHSRSAQILIGKALDDERGDGMALYTRELHQALLAEADSHEIDNHHPGHAIVHGQRNGKAWRVRLAGWTP